MKFLPHIKLVLVFGFVLLFVGLILYLSNTTIPKFGQDLSGSVNTSTFIAKDLPLDFSIIYSAGGGMLYHRETIAINSTSSYWEVMDNGKIIRHNFVISPDELLDLYNLVLQNNFFQQKDYSGPFASDQGSNTIKIIIGGKSYSVLHQGDSLALVNWDYHGDPYYAVAQQIVALGEKYRDNIPNTNIDK